MSSKRKAKQNKGSGPAGMQSRFHVSNVPRRNNVITMGANAVEDVVAVNAEAFIRARHYPWDAGDGVVFPDPDPFPVTPSHLHGRFVPPVTAFSAPGVGKYWGFRIKPDIGGFITYAALTATDPSNITTGGGIVVNSTAYTSLAADMGLYRTVALGLRIHGISQLIETGGEVIVSRLPPDTSTLFDVAEAMDSAATDVVSQVAVLEDKNGLQIRWIGITNQSGLYISGTGFLPTASAFRSPDYRSYDSEIFVVGFSEDADASIEVEVEYDLLINSVPLVTANQIFDVLAVPSSQDAMAKADLAAEMSEPPREGSQGSGMIRQGKDMVKKGLVGMGKKGLSMLSKELGPFGQIAEDLGGKALDWLGGLFLLPPEHHHRALRCHHNGGSFDELKKQFGSFDVVIKCHKLAVYSGLAGYSPLSTLPPRSVTDIPTFLEWLGKKTSEAVDLDPPRLVRSQRKRTTKKDVQAEPAVLVDRPRA